MHLRYRGGRNGVLFVVHGDGANGSGWVTWILQSQSEEGRLGLNRVRANSRALDPDKVLAWLMHVVDVVISRCLEGHFTVCSIAIHDAIEIEIGTAHWLRCTCQRDDKVTLVSHFADRWIHGELSK